MDPRTQSAMRERRKTIATHLLVDSLGSDYAATLAAHGIADKDVERVRLVLNNSDEMQAA